MSKSAGDSTSNPVPDLFGAPPTRPEDAIKSYRLWLAIALIAVVLVGGVGAALAMQLGRTHAAQAEAEKALEDARAQVATLTQGNAALSERYGVLDHQADEIAKAIARIQDNPSFPAYAAQLKGRDKAALAEDLKPADASWRDVRKAEQAARLERLAATEAAVKAYAGPAPRPPAPAAPATSD
jgi:hypothetical protein